ncbi:hypothetical protein BGX27_005527 [Mortierella sp. AM989]|nr:hypothetical protein BGX27_005527 [Mortierella sp. AM989]
MAYVRGPTRRTLTILLGLCIISILFTLTPYSDKALDQLPHGWRSETSLTVEQQQILDKLREKELYEHLRKENGNQREDILEKERLKEEKEQEYNDVNKDGTLFGNTDDESKKTTNQNNNIDDKARTDDNDGDGNDDNEPQDNLPTEFNESLFPSTSQKLLETKIGTKALERYYKERPQTVIARDASIAYSLAQANIAYRNTTVYSVVSKPASKTPPSGDIHDYTSLARYFWKNPNTPNGMPYVRLDGKPNPDMDSVWDYRLLRKVFRDCYYMGQAYFWTGDERYAEKIVFRVKEWFLNKETYMNPHLKYASLIFGSPLGRAQGVLDMFKVYGMFDALKAIEGSKAMQAEPNLIPDLQKWFTSYLTWVDNSEQAKQERDARNNHGTYFAVQYVSILEFLGRNDEAKAILEDSKDKRVGSQIRHDGAQPHETFRPISYFYSTFNLQGMMLLGIQGQTHNVDLWRYKGPIESSTIRVNAKTSYEATVGGGTIEDAIRYVSEYGVRDLSEWPYPDTGIRNLPAVLKMAKMASVIYGSERWQEYIENLEAKIDEERPEGDNGTETEATGHGEGGADGEELNSFICDLGILSNGTLWHCYK